MAAPVSQVSLHGRRCFLTKDNELALLGSDGIAQVVARPFAMFGGSSPVATVVAEHRQPQIVDLLLTCTALEIAISDDAGVAQYGGVKVYDFPAGLIMPLGAIVTGNLTGYASLIDTFAGGVALGTATATTGATLTGTEADVMPEVDVAAAVAEVAAIDAVSVATALTESGARHFDGSATAKDLYLNFVIDDNAAHGAGTALFTGTIKLAYLLFGDN